MDGPHPRSSEGFSFLIGHMEQFQPEMPIPKKWNPQRFTLVKIKYLDKPIAFNIFRNACSSYISKPDVRRYVLALGDCYICGNKATQIDHVKSVYACFHEGDIEFCNTIENLMPICARCNASKAP